MDRMMAMTVFQKVAESGSFSTAARQLGLTPSAVSKQIARLEDHLGARLLNRTTRRIGLTEVGSLYLERCSRILADMEEAELAVSAMDTIPRGTLKINGPTAFGQMHIAPHLPAFLQRYPLVRVDFTITDAFVDLVEEGVDVAIRIGELRDSALIARRLAPNRRVVCASPSYLAKHGIPAVPEDLDSHACLVFAQQGVAQPWRFRRPGGNQEFNMPVRGPLIGNSINALYSAALNDIGLAMLPTSVVGHDLQEGRLKPVLMDYVSSDTAIWAVYPHSRHLSPKVRALLDFLLEVYGKTPYWDREWQ